MFTATKKNSLISAIDYFNAGLIPQTHSVCCLQEKNELKYSLLTFFGLLMLLFAATLRNFIDTFVTPIKSFCKPQKSCFFFFYYKIKFYFYDLVKLTIVLAYILHITPILITANGKTVS